MDLLLEPLPKEVAINGSVYAVRSDFRTMIRFEQLMQSSVARSVKGLAALEMFYLILPDDIEAAVEALLWFYCCGSQRNTGGQKASSNRIYDYGYDSPYIYAAFLQTYQIDLTCADMHWWQFHALFSSLPQECEMCRIMGYRALQITNDMPKKERERYKRLKRIYSLPDNRTQEQREEDFANDLSSAF